MPREVLHLENKAYEVMNCNEKEFWWYRARRIIIRKILNEYLKEKPNAQILDIGCGTGGNLSMLSQYGNVEGVEMYQPAIQMAKQKCPRYKIFQGSLPWDLNVDNNKNYDLITAFDVLEHVDKDVESVEVLYNLLNEKGGLLIITVPAYNFLWSQSDVTGLHKRRYTKKQLERILSSSGFKVRYISYFNFFLFIPSAIGKLLLRFKKNYSADEETIVHSKRINYMLFCIFAKESAFIPEYGFPFGSSIVAVVQKG